MTDYYAGERPSKRAYLGSSHTIYDDDDCEQYFAFAEAAADAPFVVNGMNGQLQDLQQQKQLLQQQQQQQQQTAGASSGDKEGAAREHIGAGTSRTINQTTNKPVALDDAKPSNPKGTDASTNVPNQSKAEPTNKETTAVDSGSKNGKSNSSKSLSSQQQQQPTNNKKRTRATPEQLAILEETFKTNTSPNSKVREALAEKVNMSERSIQIWFQNRRAKMKAMQKRVHLMHEESLKVQLMACMPYGHPMYPLRMMQQRIALPRSYSTSDIMNNFGTVPIAPGVRPQTTGLGISMPQVPPGFWPSGPMTAPLATSDQINGFPFTASSRFPITPNASPNVNGMNASQPMIRVVNPSNAANGMPMKMDPSISTIQPQQFSPPQEYVTPSLQPSNPLVSVLSCEVLQIGTWRRILTTPTDLLCYYTLQQRTFTYHISNEGSNFKLEFPLNDVVSVEFMDNGANSCTATVTVKNAPSFYMEHQGVWSMCKDFTEGSQATQITQHVLRGRTDIMKKQLQKLSMDDAGVAKVTQFREAAAAPATNVKPEPNTAAAQSQQQQQDQQNAPRRSSFPTENARRENPGAQSEEDAKDPANRTRRSASLPLSPPEQQGDVALPSSTLAGGVNGLQINTSTGYLDMLTKTPLSNVTSRSSPEFCASPMELNSSPSTPLDMFDSHSDLLNAMNDRVSHHGLSNLTLDPSSSTLLSEDFATLASGAGLQSVSNDEFASMFAGVSTAPFDVSDFLDISDSLTSPDSLLNSSGLGLEQWTTNEDVYC